LLVERIVDKKIEDYAIIGDCHTVALVHKSGSIDWLCLPRVDSDACYAALLGTRDHGEWALGPTTPARVTRRYREGTLVLETTFENDEGRATLIDAMVMGAEQPTIVRVVRGEAGAMRFHMRHAARFDYGVTRPVIEHVAGGIRAVAGPDALHLSTPVPIRAGDQGGLADFTVKAGEEVPFVLTWSRSFGPRDGAQVEAAQALNETTRSWQAWSQTCVYQGEWREQVLRSLITLKALTYAPTGGIAAAATTSLPEHLGGSRNWDYRYCWLRDSTFTLYSLHQAGYVDEANAWREWLVRAAAGEPAHMQTLYSVTGKRRLTEIELDWLPGYAGSKPVRVGNAAATQFQLDIFGEVVDTLFQAHRLCASENGWALVQALVAHVAEVCDEPDEGIWEVRGGRQHFVHSKALAWVALDRGVKGCERGMDGPVEAWRARRDQLARDITQRGFNRELGAFVQAYDSRELDAAVLILPLVGFIDAHDPQWRSTVRAIEKGLLRDGFVQRYDSARVKDGLPAGEGAFLPCTFWLADNYHLLDEKERARETFERLLSLTNDVGLLSEEYDVASGRLVGNFPQAFSHVGLINTAFNLTPDMQSPAEQRGAR
jgi:GH15 family glucan-1,4-alpha-glucosidase